MIFSSAIQKVCTTAGLLENFAGAGDSGLGLGGEFYFQALEQQLEFFLRLGVARHDHGAPVSRWQMHIDHRHGGELLEHRTYGEPWCEVAQPPLQGHLQAEGEERDEDMRFDAVLALMVDGTDGQPFRQAQGPERSRRGRL